MKNIHLPTLNSINIENYSLYIQQPSFKFNFSDGISAIIGGNGIGKTTFVEILLFCLVGERKIYPVLGKKKIKTKEKILDPKYFVSRMNLNFEKNKDAKAFLDFNISENNIVVGRSLYNNKIEYLKVNNDEIVLFDEEFYQQLIMQYTGINSFQSLDSIVRTFLFFDERRQNIAWDPEVQDEILRILFFDDEFLDQFKQLEEEVIYLDTTGRHRSEDRRVEKQSLEDLIKDKNKLYKEIENENIDNDLEKLFHKKNLLNDQSMELNQIIEGKIYNFNELNESLNNKIGERSEVYQKLEIVNNELSKLESKLYASIYNQLPEYYLSIERVLVSEGKCLSCGSKSKQAKEVAISRKKNGECVICSSKIQIAEEYDPNLINKINELSEQRNQYLIIVSNQDDLLAQQQKNVAENNREINELKENFSKIQREIIYLDSIIATQSIDSSQDTFGQILEAKQKKIEKLSNDILKIYKERDEKTVELNKLHNNFSRIIVSLNKHLSYFFNKYASTFIGLDCELTVQNKVINKIPHVLYLPRISGSVREGVNSVSESQRFFLDQAFRMAIIDYLQNTIEGFKTFFITETPEGSLDIVYEAQVAEMFILFAGSSNNIIFTSNLNSSNFLLKMYEKINIHERKVRTLNLLEKGNPTKLQKENLELNKLQYQLLGGE